MSAILSTDTLNDFITPSVACIKPVETLPSKPALPDNANEVEIYDSSKPSSSLNRDSSGAAGPAQISLTDCLACSGCVTSAEAVLVSLQSHSEALNALDSGPGFEFPVLDDEDEGLGLRDTYAYKDTNIPTRSSKEPGPESEAQGEGQSKIYVASISPQTLASLSTTFSLPPSTTKNLIHQFLSGPQGLARGGKWGNKFDYTVDTTPAQEACLVLGAEEVLSQFSTFNTKIKEIKKPILSSSCPGWICYAEKTHPHILPHLSRLKSPQALTGTLLKTVLSKKYGINPSRIWHVAIMPCFDKKLEASRAELTDLYWDHDDTTMKERGERKGKGIRDVDCVITSKELLMLASTRGVDLLSLPRSPLSSTSKTPFPDSKLSKFLFPHHHTRSPHPRPSKKQDPIAGTSGGQLWYILHYIQALHPLSTIQHTRGRNADVIDYTVTSSSGEILFKTARYYGFRNIQNLVRRLKPARMSRMPGAKPVGGVGRQVGKGDGVEQGYVEVMACPGGCTNGGGQVKADDDDVVIGGRYNSNDAESNTKAGPQEQKGWLTRVDEAYFSADTPESSDEEDDVGDTPMDTESNGVGDEVDGISPSYIKDTLAHWVALTGFPLDKLAYTTYREVVSDVGKKIGDTERVVQLASKMGGGW